MKSALATEALSLWRARALCLVLTRREVIAYYCGKIGFDAGDFSFHEVYGLFRLSAIAQQIYYRYHHGQTRNPAFKRFWLFVNYLHWRCRRAMKHGNSKA